MARLARAKLRLHIRQKAKRDNPEHRLHVAVAEYLALALRPPTLWTSLDAGAGKMSKAAAGMRKARGVKAGWPDILIMHPGGHYRTLVVGIELKSKKGGLSDEQRLILECFLGCNAKMWIARSLEDVEGVLRSMGVPVYGNVHARPS